MFVGFDPGTTAALAVVNLRGDVLLIKTFRGGVSEAISILKKYNLAVIASDKKELASVKKLAAAFGAFTYFPKENLSVLQKKRITSKYNISNDHERDALAAALFAYKKYRKTTEKVLKLESLLLRDLLLEKTPNVKAVFQNKSKTLTEKRKKNRELERRVQSLEKKLELSQAALYAERKTVELLKKRKQVIVQKNLPRDYRMERAARIRLEKELMEAHSRIGKIEAELDNLKKQPVEEKENIRERILRMLKEYKERFR